MKDNKFKVLCYLFAAWLGLFLLTLRFKSPRLEAVDMFILFICFVWFAYWTFSAVKGLVKGNPEPVKSETEKETNGNTKKKKSV